MSPEETTPQAGELDKPESTSNGKTPIDSLPPDIQAYIESLRKENGKYRTAATAAEKAAKEAEEKRLIEQQEWKSLADKRGAELAELEQVQAQAEQIQAAFNASLEMRLKAVPSDVLDKTVKPIREALPPHKFSEWLDANLDLLTTKKAPSLDAGARGVQQTMTTIQLTPMEREMAAAAGMTDKEYAEYKAKRATAPPQPGSK